MRNKKAMAVAALITLILAAIILGMFIYIGYLMSSEGRQAGKIETCRLTIWANAGFREHVTEAEHVAINCPKKMLEVGEGRLKDFYKIERGTEEQKKSNSVKRLLAEEMRECWYKGHEGKVYPFPDKPGKFCLVCSQISFDEEVQENYEDPTNFVKYTAKEKMIFSNITYLEYFSGRNIDGDLSEFDLHGKDVPEGGKKGGKKIGTFTDEIYLSKEYSTLFIIEKEDMYKKTAIKLIGFAGGSALGGALAWTTITVLALIPEPGTTMAAVGAASALIVGTAGAIAGGYGGAELGYSYGKRFPTYTARVEIEPYNKIYDIDCTYLIDHEEGEYWNMY